MEVCQFDVLRKVNNDGQKRIFEYDKKHPDEPSLALEVAQYTHSV